MLYYHQYQKGDEHMDTDKRKLIGVRVDEETHRQMKLYAVSQGITIQDYLMNLIKKDMEKQKKEK